jgi:ComEC/Rec2-related protein
VPTVGLPPAIALAAGAAAAIALDRPTGIAAWTLVVCVAGCAVAYARQASVVFVAFTVAAFCSAGWTLAADARRDSLQTPLRSVLTREFGGFDIATPGPGGRHAPLRLLGVVIEDASVADDLATVRMRVTAIDAGHGEERVDGRVTFSIGGTTAAGRAGEWTKGRTLQMQATFRRPTRYLNDGVPDFERDLALAGTTLFGSVKSGLLVEVVARGGGFDEAAAAVRRYVRRAVARWIAPHDAVSAAIVTAVLIGDRTGLPDAVRLRLQAAGTYHVIAISGGNIAILAALLMGALLVVGVTGRPAAVITLLVLIAYAGIVSAGASVWRATVMAAVYLVARALDHRSPSWHAIAVAVAVVTVADPLQVRDAGFLLTFGATAALLEVARRAASLFRGRPLVRWIVVSLAASAAAEIALLPVSAWTFSRVTSAGLALNLLAVPLMTVVQVGGLVVCAFDAVARGAAVVGASRLFAAAPEWLLEAASIAGGVAPAAAHANVST